VGTWGLLSGLLAGSWRAHGELAAGDNATKLGAELFSLFVHFFFSLNAKLSSVFYRVASLWAASSAIELRPTMADYPMTGHAIWDK
jgi:hypothetical protein